MESNYNTPNTLIIPCKNKWIIFIFDIYTYIYVFIHLCWNVKDEDNSWKLINLLVGCVLNINNSASVSFGGISNGGTLTVFNGILCVNSLYNQGTMVVDGILNIITNFTIITTAFLTSSSNFGVMILLPNSFSFFQCNFKFFH